MSNIYYAVYADGQLHFCPGIGGCTRDELPREICWKLKLRHIDWYECLPVCQRNLPQNELLAIHLQTIRRGERLYHLSELVNQAKQEVLHDISAGIVPATVNRFAQLHDHVDANGYGGAFEIGFEVSEIGFWEYLQRSLDAWLQRGRQ